MGVAVLIGRNMKLFPKIPVCISTGSSSTPSYTDGHRSILDDRCKDRTNNFHVMHTYPPFWDHMTKSCDTSCKQWNSRQPRAIRVINHCLLFIRFESFLSIPHSLVYLAALIMCGHNFYSPTHPLLCHWQYLWDRSRVLGRWG